MKVVLYGALAFAAWALLTIPYYVCNVMEFCDDNAKSAEVVPIVEEVAIPENNQPKSDLGNLVFNWESDLPITNNEFMMVKDSLLEGLKDSSRTLIIEGRYFSEERNNSQFEDLGLARGNAVKSLLINEGFDENITVSSQLIADKVEDVDNPFLGVAFSYNSMEKEESAFTITEAEGKIVINFPVASADPTLNKVLDERMAQLATKVKGSDVMVEISGHTDNTGSTEQNYSYGLARANAIKNLLVSKAVSIEKITVESKGETMPIADNNTEDGKRKNRRVEIVINQKK